MSKTIRVCIALFISILCVHGISIAETANTYFNERFGYSVLLPPSFVWDGESENGDGQKFSSQDKKLEVLVYGRNNVLEESASELFKKAFDSKTGIKTKYVDSLGYRLEGNKDGIGYIEQAYVNEETVISCYISYPEAQEKEHKSIADSIVNSFKFATHDSNNDQNIPTTLQTNSVSSSLMSKDPDQIIAKVKASQPPPLNRSGFPLAYALESFCTECSWRYFTSKSGQDIIECSGSAREEFLDPGVKMNFCIQYEVIPDTDVPKVVYFEANGEKQPPETCVQLHLWAMGAAIQRHAKESIPNKVE